MESITYVAPIMQAFGGKATLSFGDLGVNEADLPLDVVEPAAQRLLDPTKLRPFAKYRKQVHRACGAIGTRADGGGYGYCEDTGEPIGLDRLKANPTARYTVEALTVREKRNKQYGTN